jgi:hypothetical protein
MGAADATVAKAQQTPMVMSIRRTQRKDNPDMIFPFR